MKKLTILLIALFCLNLSGCVYHLNIQQGVIVTPKQVRTLHKGMSTGEVTTLLGYPLLVNTFQNNRILYVYTYQPGHKPMQERKLIINFRNGRLTNYSYTSNKAFKEAQQERLKKGKPDDLNL